MKSAEEFLNHEAPNIRSALYIERKRVYWIMNRFAECYHAEKMKELSNEEQQSCAK